MRSVVIAHVAIAAFGLDIVCELLHDTAPSLLHSDVKVLNGHEEPRDAGVADQKEGSRVGLMRDVIC
ncbi:hypothetical protein HETIRDRAFT_407417 [Heterobasidion irregulare TC 32-1]|uniref:Uncharacterized protein n=1 Tax=Heterobasidion irregulare (strain TC 32-1) TaxID=747525 RepID=W4KJI5_HETIT|nr:uncharacterized protein HETIRDRAFT_407417 [Heterobasidion irregulare TC 32-1]ETW85226.1 hypothetical protein HETIRDRAFT_407417 [Heterobasidion irregulare TC 32-1]